jgi:hypothetical protein
LVRETGFETFLMDLGLAPDEWLGICIEGINEGVDVLSELSVSRFTLGRDNWPSTTMFSISKAPAWGCLN